MKRALLLFFFVVISAAGYAQIAPEASPVELYRDPSAPVEDRGADL